MVKLKDSIQHWRPWLLTVLMLCVTSSRAADLWINEVLFNPPGTDIPNEYVELRGTPNLILTNGTYFVAVEGDMNENPGTVQNVFDLSGLQVSGGGFIVLLQRSNLYAWHTNATVIVNTNGDGFGDGPTSTVRHRGENEQHDLENGSVTFFLIQSTNYPSIGADIDANNDGLPDGALYASWTVLDSVAILDPSGLGDIGYGLINFRRNTAPGNGATVLNGTIVPVGFTPNYVARSTNSTNWAASSWVAAGIVGTAPNWATDNTSNTEPPSFANRALNHIGAPNFGAAALAGVAARDSGSGTDLIEGSGTDFYTLALNTTPGGNVTVQINAGVQLQVSIDGGLSYGTTRAIVLSNTSPSTNILVRALDDIVVDASPHVALVTHTITASANPAQYPVGSLMPQLRVRITENDTLLLNELKVNPPGPDDAPAEFIELRGTPNATLTNVYLLVIDGNNGQNPGTATVVIDLSGAKLGSAGLLVILADGHPYSVPGGAGVFLAPELSTPGGGLDNGSINFLLVSSLTPIIEGTDLDAGDNGILEGLPAGVTVLDSVGWLDGDSGDVGYTPALLSQLSGTPDAATRFPGNTNASSAAAWVNGDLEGSDPDSLIYAATGGSTNLTYGTLLTLGAANNTAPGLYGVTAFSCVIGDPTTPPIVFQIADAQTPVASLSVTATSSDQLIVPDANLILSGSGSSRTLTINPVGVGYATLTIHIGDGNMTGLGLISFAASADLRGGGRFLTGVCDASTALALDANYMLVGDDENQVLRIYSRSVGSPGTELEFAL